MLHFGLIFNDFFLCNGVIFVGRVNFIKSAVKVSFAVLPEIVPAPEFHRSVFTLALTRSWRSITFGRSFNFQGAYGFQQNKKHRTNSNGHSYPTSNRLSVRCLGSIILRLSPHTRLRKWVLSSRNTNMLVFAVCCSFERYVHSTSYGAK